jgi:hypothetical protein
MKIDQVGKRGEFTSGSKEEPETIQQNMTCIYHQHESGS